jgi:hypothetical protein
MWLGGVAGRGPSSSPFFKNPGRVAYRLVLGTTLNCPPSIASSWSADFASFLSHQRVKSSSSSSRSISAFHRDLGSGKRRVIPTRALNIELSFRIQRAGFHRTVEPISVKRDPPARQLSCQKGACPHPLPPPASEGLGSAAISLRRSAHRKHKMMISERYRRVDVVATQQEDHTWLARAGDLQLPFRYPTAKDALREARAHVDGARGWHAKNH